MITMDDFDDVWLGAVAGQERWERQFMEKQIQPIVNDMIAQTVASLTQEQQDFLRNNNPQMWAQLNRRIGGKHANSTARGNMGQADLRYSSQPGSPQTSNRQY